jgi:hypothetical protein
MDLMDLMELVDLRGHQALRDVQERMVYLARRENLEILDHRDQRGKQELSSTCMSMDHQVNAAPRDPGAVEPPTSDTERVRVPMLVVQSSSIREESGEICMIGMEEGATTVIYRIQRMEKK